MKKPNKQAQVKNYLLADSLKSALFLFWTYKDKTVFLTGQVIFQRFSGEISKTFAAVYYKKLKAFIF